MLPYTQEKRHAEEWCKKYADAGHGCIAARWGGKLLSSLNPVLPSTDRSRDRPSCVSDLRAAFIGDP